MNAKIIKYFIICWVKSLYHKFFIINQILNQQYTNKKTKHKYKKPV